MRQRLNLARSDLSPEKAPLQLRRIQRYSVSINQTTPISGLSIINSQQAGVLAALIRKKPTQDTQISLLQWQSRGFPLYESVTYIIWRQVGSTQQLAKLLAVP